MIEVKVFRCWLVLCLAIMYWMHCMKLLLTLKLFCMLYLTCHSTQHIFSMLASSLSANYRRLDTACFQALRITVSHVFDVRSYN